MSLEFLLAPADGCKTTLVSKFLSLARIDENEPVGVFGLRLSSKGHCWPEELIVKQPQTCVAVIRALSLPSASRRFCLMFSYESYGDGLE